MMLAKGKRQAPLGCVRAWVISSSSWKSVTVFSSGTPFPISWTLCPHRQCSVAAQFKQPLCFVTGFAGNAGKRQLWRPVLKAEGFPMEVSRWRDLALGQAASSESIRSSETSDRPSQLPSAAHWCEQTSHRAHLIPSPHPHQLNQPC